MAPTRATEGHGHSKIVKVGWLASGGVIVPAGERGAGYCPLGWA